jgi:hypothetical protein
MAANLEEADPSLIERLEEVDREEDTYDESPPLDVVAYNELRSCADIFRMSDEGDLIIQPEFQRDFIWKASDQTRFIDSLVKQLPVPSMCFALDYRQNLWIVIDGLQRISTITRFLSGSDWKLSDLADIDPALRGKTAATLKNAKSGENKTLFSRVQNQALPVNVLRCDFTKRNHNEYIFTIFHRLNSGGLKLTNQEIRNCIYSGKLNDLLKELDNNPAWRRINNMRDGNNYRFAKQETILRFFAFFEQRDNYKGSVSKFLNDYMYDNRNPDDKVISDKRNLFNEIVRLLSEHVFADGVPGRLPGTVLEAAMVGMAAHLPHVQTLAPNELRDRFNELRQHQSLSAEYLAEGLSKPDRVAARLGAAIEIFGRA